MAKKDTKTITVRNNSRSEVYVTFPQAVTAQVEDGFVEGLDIEIPRKPKADYTAPGVEFDAADWSKVEKNQAIAGMVSTGVLQVQA